MLSGYMVLAALQKKIPVRSKLLIAVSGGADSMGLLAGILALQAELGLTVQVAHYNHRLRLSSDADAAFVRQFVEDVGCVFYEEVAGERPPQENVESWARRNRYDFLGRIRHGNGLDFIVTAHQLDDVVETFLLRLLSNRDYNGIEELCDRRHLLRPLLEVRKKELELYCESKGIPFIFDESNNDVSRLRNKVRKVLVPFLETEFGEGSINALLNQAEGMFADSLDLRRIAIELKGNCGEEPFGSKEWLRQTKLVLDSLPRGVAWRLVELLFQKEVGFFLGRRHSLILLNFLFGNGRELRLPGKIAAIRENGGILLKKQEPHSVLHD
jgi:tRNA(Ile)-lysidine synthase